MMEKAGAQLSLARPCAQRLPAGFTEAELANAGQTIRGWPEYRPTPLVSLPAQAALLGLAGLWLKDEGERAIGSFKMLGGAYAVARIAADHKASGSDRTLHVSTASAGNHGLSVAWAAARERLPCTVYLPANTSAARANRIRETGAEVRPVEGSYEDAVRRCRDESTDHGWTIVQDFASDEDLPCRLVMTGYTVIADEILAQLSQPLSHVFLQCGVGGMAAAVSWKLASELRPRPTFISVEPIGADCLRRSIEAGEIVAATASGSIMSCIDCADLSLPAWELLRDLIDGSVAISDDWTRMAMRIGAEPAAGDPRVDIGINGAAGLAGLLAAASRPEFRAAIGLGPDSNVLVINTERSV